MTWFLENMHGKIAVCQGSQTLNSLKSLKYVLIGFCIFMLTMSLHFSYNESDITPAPPKNPSNTNNDKGLLCAKGHDLERDLTLENQHSQLPAMNRVKRTPDQRETQSSEEKKKIRSSRNKFTDLLIMYPCCATIIIILGMEVFGQGLRNPLNKFTNLILIFLCIILSLVMFIVSLLTAIRTIETSMIIISTLSFLFLVLEFADFVILILS